MKWLRYSITGLVWFLIILNVVIVRQALSQPLPSIVSTHLCADQLALSLAAPEQILSVSYKSQDPQRSSYAEQAQIYPGNRGSSEEIIQLKPDLVLASRRWRNHPQQNQFDALGIRVVVVPISNSWQDIFTHTQWLADLMGRSHRGRELIEEVRQRLRAIQHSELSQTPVEQSILFLRPNGGTAGSSTYIDMLIEAMNFKNHASEMRLEGWGQLPLEKIIMTPPDYFLLSGYVRDSAYAKSQLSRHPLLQKLFENNPILSIPSDHGSCASWQIIETVEYLLQQLSNPMKNRDKPRSIVGVP